MLTATRRLPWRANFGATLHWASAFLCPPFPVGSCDCFCNHITVSRLAQYRRSFLHVYCSLAVGTTSCFQQTKMFRQCAALLTGTYLPSDSLPPTPYWLWQATAPLWHSSPHLQFFLTHTQLSHLPVWHLYPCTLLSLFVRPRRSSANSCECRQG